MATRNIVPRGDGEGQLGRTNLFWFNAFLKNNELDCDITGTSVTTLSVAGGSSVTFADIVSVVGGGGSGGSTSFTGLTDTPASYSSGDAGKVLTVNSTENGVEFVTPSAGTATNIIYTNNFASGDFTDVDTSIYEEGSPDVNGVNDKSYIEIIIPAGVTNPKYFMLNILDSLGWGIQPHAYRYEADALSGTPVPKIIVFFYNDTIAPIDVSVNFING